MIGKLKGKLSAWWLSRSEREQKILSVMTVLLVVSVFYNYGYKTFADEHVAASNEFQKASGDYRWLKERMREIKDFSGGIIPSQETPEQKLTSIEKYLAEHNVQATVERVEQRGKIYFEVQVNNAKGPRVMQWIEALMKNGYPVSGFRFEVSGKSKDNVTGRVIVQVVQ